MLFYFSVILHIFGFTMLMGGIFVGLRAARMTSPPVELLKSIRFGYIVAGETLVVITGIYQMVWAGLPYYFKQGWFHGKLSVAILLLGTGMYVFKQIKNVEKSGTPLSRRMSGILHSVAGILFLLAIVFTILGRAGLI